jgi:flagellar motor switch protein FliG
VSTSGARKAAMLLRSLDPSTAAELLQSAAPEMLTEIAVEVAVLEQDQAGADRASQESIREFSGLLQGRGSNRTGGHFAKEMLQIVLGDQGSAEVLSQVDQRLQMLDPFRQIRSAGADAIAEALAGESAQAASVVLSELSAKKSAELIGLLDEGTRDLAVACMAGVQSVSPATRQRIAGVVQGRMEQVAKDRALNGGGAGDGAGQSRERHRKVAVLLRSLEVELRNQMIESLTKQDSEAAKCVQELMVTWDDIDFVAERSLQEALMSVDSRKLALALVDASELMVERINGNMSERAQAMLEEEVSLLSKPKPAEIEQAREEILNVFREMNKRGDLEFEEN